MGLMLSSQARRELLQQMIPRYRDGSAAQKGELLDQLAATTGYARRYAMWLMNHPPEGQHPQGRRRPRQYGSDVQHALFLVWNAANRICTKRLMPFLPTLTESLERHEHLQITPQCREQLLSMSAATADRLLSSQRKRGLRGISTTRAGTLLKQQIPIRTFEQWNETRPSFLEADLVAHCGSQIEGSFLYTLTLTDIATGWTECLPLLSKSSEAVLSALQQARACFPFPILGLDTDNGCEFINEQLLTYCEHERITFTRGREGLKNDQCFVEQKNGTIVRQVVGYNRFEGERAYRQLSEVYQALRLYVNGFQPSMKLQAKQYDGERCVGSMIRQKPHCNVSCSQKCCLHAACIQGEQAGAGSPGAGPAAALSPPARPAAGTLWLDDEHLPRRGRNLSRGCPPVLRRTVYRRASYCRPCDGGGAMAGAGDAYSSP